LEIAAHQHPYVVPGVARLPCSMPNCGLSALFKAIWLEKMLFGMFGLFFGSVGRKKVLVFF